ncbi:hypothetical protein BHE74_00004131 [Ensete ventricosum]|nr:hypothetical protein BHE74_00004131 [Ensete ventricosum]
MASARQFELAKESELRVEIGSDAPLRLRLLSGTAEIFGTELPPGNWISAPPHSKIATPMVSYVNVHAILDARRARAKSSQASGMDSSQVLILFIYFYRASEELSVLAFQGPRVIVVGPTDSGKSSLCKMLLSWACKLGWKPTYVDLDIGQGSITIPGCIAATPVEMPIDVMEGIPLEMPIVYFYGHTTPRYKYFISVLLYHDYANGDLYKVLVKELAGTLERQFSGNVEARAAGMVINTMGWVEGLGYELLLHAIDTFKCDVVLVLGQEKLCSMLKDVLKSKPNVDVVKLHKSGGVVLRNQRVRQKTRSLRIRATNICPLEVVLSGNVVSKCILNVRTRPQGCVWFVSLLLTPCSYLIPILIALQEYFYGLANDLSPHSNIVNFTDISVYRIGGGPQAPRSALPIGAEPVADPTRVVAVNVNRDLLHLILAVSYAKEPDQIISSCFVIKLCCCCRKKITYIAPCPGELPSKILIVGTLTWLES